MIASLLKPIKMIFKGNIPNVIRFASIDDSDIFNKILDESYKNWLTFKKPQGVNVSLDIFKNAQDYLASHSAEPFNIVVSDIIMPNMSGWELYDQLIKDSKNVNLIIGLQSIDFDEKFNTTSIMNKKSLSFSTLWGLYEAFENDIVENRIEISVRKFEHEHNGG